MMLAALLLVVQVGVAAQDPRLERLDPETRARVASLVDSARALGLPGEPLIQRALEGAAKGAAGPRIAAAVRRLATDLGTARTALGGGHRTSAPELEAGVAALRAGASPEVLTRLRDARRPPLTMALAVLADLVASGVHADSASAVVLAMAPTARDADLVEFRKAVERDISLGAPPGASAAVRAANTGIRFGTSDAGQNPSQPPRPPSRP